MLLEKGQHRTSHNNALTCHGDVLRGCPGQFVLVFLSKSTNCNMILAQLPCMTIPHYSFQFISQVMAMNSFGQTQLIKHKMKIIFQTPLPVLGDSSQMYQRVIS